MAATLTYIVVINKCNFYIEIRQSFSRNTVSRV